MSNKLKLYTEQILLVTKEIKELEEEISELSNEKLTLHEKLQLLNVELDKLKGKKIHITDHAIIRFIERHPDLINERFENINVNELKKYILPEKLLPEIHKLGNGEYPVNNEFKIVIKDFNVVTVL